MLPCPPKHAQGPCLRPIHRLHSDSGPRIHWCGWSAPSGCLVTVLPAHIFITIFWKFWPNFVIFKEVFPWICNYFNLHSINYGLIKLIPRIPFWLWFSLFVNLFSRASFGFYNGGLFENIFSIIMHLIFESQFLTVFFMIFSCQIVSSDFILTLKFCTLGVVLHL